MLILSTRLSNISLLAIRTAGRIGQVIEPLINPHNLHIDGFYCLAAFSPHKLILLDMFVREIAPTGIITNEHNDLSEPDELVRLQPVIKLNFKLEGKTVISGKQKLGKVAEYAVDKDSLFVQKLYVAPPIWQSLNQNRLTIDRRSILEVTDTYIKVTGSEQKAPVKRTVKAPLLATDYSPNTSFTKE
jgi:hypothetical protein